MLLIRPARQRGHYKQQTKPWSSVGRREAGATAEDGPNTACPFAAFILTIVPFNLRDNLSIWTAERITMLCGVDRADVG